MKKFSMEMNKMKGQALGPYKAMTFLTARI